MSALKTIGVIGGMGPAATVQFMDRVIRLTEAADDIDHVPMIVDQNTQIPSRIKALIEGEGADPSPVIVDMAKRLEAQGCSAIVMPCNTAHHFAEQISAAVDVPFLNMIELSGRAVYELVGKGGAVGMLASPATDQLGVFQSVFDRFDLHAVFPEKADQVLALIRHIKASGPGPDSTGQLNDLASSLSAADSLLVGCSEFSMISDQIRNDLTVLDTVDILAEATIRFSGARLRQNTPAERCRGVN